MRASLFPLDRGAVAAHLSRTSTPRPAAIAAEERGSGQGGVDGKAANAAEDADGSRQHATGLVKGPSGPALTR